MKILSLDASDAGACARTAQMILQYHRAVPFGLPNEKLIFWWKMVDWMHRLWTLRRTDRLWQKLVEPADSEKSILPPVVSLLSSKHFPGFQNCLVDVLLDFQQVPLCKGALSYVWSEPYANKFWRRTISFTLLWHRTQPKRLNNTVIKYTAVTSAAIFIHDAMNSRTVVFT